MQNSNGFKLATSIVLAMTSTAALAAAPTTTQLPGAGNVVVGSSTTMVGAITSGQQTITLGGNAVINWGAATGATINATGASSQPGGFNIGSGAALTFGGSGGVLNVDVSGNASQIFGGLSSTAGNLFVANANGIIVGPAASISSTAGDVGLIANTLGATTDFDGTIASVSFNGTSGNVAVNTGASIDGTNVLIFGGLTNSGQITTAGGTRVTGGDLVNNGQISTGYTQVTAGNLINGGAITGSGFIDVYDGNVTNNGSMAVGDVMTTNGSIVNNGTIITYSGTFQTFSKAYDPLFTEGADYSITNNGTITNNGSNPLLVFYVNSQSNQINKAGTLGVLNGSTGSFTNTGTLQVAPNQSLGAYANNNINLGGKLQIVNGTTVKTVSASNPLASLGLIAGGYGFSSSDDAFANKGVLTVSTPVSFITAFLAGPQVSLLSNLSSVNIDGSGNPGGNITIVAGAQQASGYAVRVGSGVTVSAHSINVNGDVAGDNPNVLVNGTLSAYAIRFGKSVFDNDVAISDLFTGPSGSLVMYNDGTNNPDLILNFTGTVKTVPYNNASNFRFNGLPVNVTDGSPLTVELNPVAYQTNGTSNGLSAVNMLVNSNVTLQSDLPATAAGVPTAHGSAVTGVIKLPNTHLVLQSSGSITTQGAAVKNFYWPGYVYLGNVSANADGSAAPGTLGLGTITTQGGFNNVLPGDIAGASGIHFITQSAMVLGGNVITNANAWVNFGTDLLTQAYAGGTLSPGVFFGGAQGSGGAVNYGPLASTGFVTQTPSATP